VKEIKTGKKGQQKQRAKNRKLYTKESKKEMRRGRKHVGRVRNLKFPHLRKENTQLF
jgi:hypothetical protein